MNVGEWFLWPELRQSSPTRKAKPSYKSPVSQSTAAAFSADGVRSTGQRKQRGTVCQRVWLLDTVGLDAILPTRPRRFLARDLQRPGLLSGQTGSSRHNQGSQ